MHKKEEEIHKEKSEQTTAPDETSAPSKPTFRQLRTQHPFDVFEFAHDIRSHPDIVYQMIRGEPVDFGDARRILQALSRLVGQEYTLENTTIPIKQEGEKSRPVKKRRFDELYFRHHFNIVGLAAQANVRVNMVDKMLLGQSVTQDIAGDVLAALSLRTGEKYSLENVQVNVSNARGSRRDIKQSEPDHASAR